MGRLGTGSRINPITAAPPAEQEPSDQPATRRPIVNPGAGITLTNIEASFRSGRDGTGKIVDLFLRPASWFLGFGTLSIVSGTSEGIVVMESHHKDFAELEKSSVDFYPVLRSAFYQNRMGEIWDRRQHRKP